MEVIREETEKREQYTGKEMGTCRFCGKRRLVRYAGGLTQEELDKIATDECNCDGAIKERNIRYETSKARTAVEKVIMPRYPKAGAILKEAADSTAHGLFHAVTIGLGDGAKATMTVNRKGAISVKLSETIITTIEDAVEMELVQDE